MAIQLTGYSDSDKIPGFYSERVFGAGPINIRTIPLVMLCCGLKSSAGTITVDTDVVEITSTTDANAYAGQGSELGRMLNAAIREARGYRLMACSPTGGGGASAAVTVTYVGSASSNGYWYYYIGGTKISVAVSSGDAIATQATALAAAITKLPDLPVTASASLGVCTITLKHAGIRGNQWIIYQDKTSTTAPGTTTSTLGGGSAVTSSTNVNGVFFASGTGTETMTAVLATLQPGRYDRCVWAQNDATSLAAIATQCDAKAGPLEGRSEHNVVAANGTSNAAISLAQTTLNNARFQLCHMFEAETHPSEIAAAMCAKRAATEQSKPCSGYDGYEFVTVQPHRFPGQTPTRTTQQTQLDAGVTPIKTVNGKAQVVRAITTHCLNGSTPDYRTIDVSMSVVPDYMAEVVRLRWLTFVAQNPNVQDNPGENDPLPPSGVAYPDLWNAEVISELRAEEARGTICQVSDNLPESEFNSAAQRIMTRMPVVPTPIQHAIGVLVPQLNAA
jgi:phage tail sheath gpL-like